MRDGPIPSYVKIALSPSSFDWSAASGDGTDSCRADLLSQPSELVVVQVGQWETDDGLRK